MCQPAQLVAVEIMQNRSVRDSFGETRESPAEPGIQGSYKL